MIAIVIPLVGSDPHRLRNFEYVKDHYGDIGKVYRGWGTTIGQARNQGALMAHYEGHEMLFFCDSDMVINPDAVILATKVAETTESIVYPYSRLTRLSEYQGEQFRSDASKVQPTGTFPEAGALAIPMQGFINVCGYPNLSWGEDNIFHNICQRLLGASTRMDGDAFHLWHPPGNNHRFDARTHQVVMATGNPKISAVQVKQVMRKSKYYDIPTFEALGYKP